MARLERRLAPPDYGTMLDVLLEERAFVPYEDAEALAGVGSERALRAGRHLAAPETIDRLAAAATGLVEDFHAEHPSEAGISREVLRRTLGAPPDTLDAVLARTGLRIDGELVRSARHRTPTARIEAQLADSGLAPGLPASSASPGHCSARSREGTIVVAGPFAYRRQDFERARSIVRDLIDREGPQTTSALRQALGISRRHAVPLLEEMDRQGITRRRGETRA